MFNLRSRNRVGCQAASPWRRAIAILLILPLTFTGCLGSGKKAPQGSQDEILHQYRDQYEDERPDPADPTAQPTGTVPPTASSTGDQSQRIVLSAGTDLPDDLQRDAGRNSSFRLINGVPEYVIGVGDVLKVTSYIEPDPSEASLPVQQDGTIFFPRFDLGYIQAAGLSPSELAQVLIDRVREYVPAVHFDVAVELFGAWLATMSGEVMVRTRPDTGPGRFPLKGRTTVSEFIFEHGGPTSNAGLSDVRLVRDGVTVHLDISSALTGEVGNQDLVLDANDVIMVPSRLEGSGRYFVLGEVRQPGSFPMTEGATVMDAIAQAGSFTQFADAPAVFIGRQVAAGGEVIPVNVSTIVTGGGMSDGMMLRPGDYVIVPRAKLTFWQRARDWIVLTTLVINILVILQLR